MRFVSILFVLLFVACATTRPAVTESPKITASALTPTVIIPNEPVAIAPTPCHKIEITPESDYCQTQYQPSDPCYVPVCGCPYPPEYKPVVGSDGRTIHACLIKPRADAR